MPPPRRWWACRCRTARTWNELAASAAAEWNAGLARSRLVVANGPTPAAEYGDGINQVIFASSLYGFAFPERTLAVTLVLPLDGDPDQVRCVEADVLVNLTYSWNSYRGPERASSADLRRVLVHEFGHVLGLGHPDEATPAQNVAAIMNSAGGGVESLQADDRNGVALLYDTPFAQPRITLQPQSRTVAAGGAATLAVAVDGRAAPLVDAFHSYRWFHRAPGASEFEVLFTIHQPGNLEFPLAQPLDSGSYFYRVVTPDHTVESETVALTVNPVALAAPTSLANLSTRGVADTGANSMVVGFVLAGSRPKSVLLRSIGPTLGANFQVPGALAAAGLVVKNQAGTIVATSPAVWDQSPDAAAIRATSDRVGAFPLPAGSRDAVVLVTLPPGLYTAETTTGGTRGVALVEVYDADPVRDPASRLVNLSTRGFVDTGAELMIAGFVVDGPGPRNYLIRVAGDTLRDFGVAGTLDDPYLRLFRGNTLVRETDDWDSPAAVQPALRAVGEQVGAFLLQDRQECVMLVTLPPGNYSAQVRSWEGEGVNPQGVALIEVYELPAN